MKLQWRESIGGGRFAFIGDYKIVDTRMIGVVVEECDDKMPTGTRYWFKTVKEALAAIA